MELSWPDWASGHPTQVTHDTVSQGTDTHYPEDVLIKTAWTYIMQKMSELNVPVILRGSKIENVKLYV